MFIENYKRKAEQAKADYEIAVKKLDTMLKAREDELDAKYAKKEAELELRLARQIKDGDEQMLEYECTWHDNREKRRVELAKLDARIEWSQDAIGANEAKLTATIEAQNVTLQTQELMIAHLKEVNKTLAEAVKPNLIEVEDITKEDNN